jgi:two-component system, chemotaxis family, protein-glutamate methylesterase/glutaminase
LRQVGEIMIKVMVVDDSVFMRKMITNMLEKEKDIEIVATAKNGKEAVELNLKVFTRCNNS